MAGAISFFGGQLRMRYNKWSVRLVPLAFFLLWAVNGCGGPTLYAVKGKVTYPDDSPVTEGLVVFENTGGEKPVSAQGDIGPDGAFVLSTFKPGDGVPPGSYKAMIGVRKDMKSIDHPSKSARRPFDAKYMSFDTSGLAFEVKPGANEFHIKVTK
jgi:hypothetical protein